jgi:choline-sulfatase
VVVDRALEWLTGQVQSPFFCWVHLYDPHAPYQDHQDQFGKRFVDRPYDAEIAYVDGQVGRLLEFVKQHGLDDRTLIVVVGDHGEGLNEHQERRHGQMLYNSTLHVPWIMSFPGKMPEGRRIETPVCVADIYPTLIEAGNLKGAARTSGQSVMSLVRGQEVAARALYAETNEPLLESGWSPLRSLISGQWKYIRTPREELYDLIKDPGETQNLATELQQQTQSLEQQLAELERGLKVHQGNSVKLSPAELKKLASLGYVGSTGNADELEVNPKLHDIKEMIPHYNALEDARLLLDTGKWDEAEQQLTKLVAVAPDLEFAEISLGDVQLRRGKLKAAQAVYERILKRNPECSLAYLHLGDICEAQGQYQLALVHYEKALEWEPDSAKLHYNIGRIQVFLNRDDYAVPHFEEALQLDPGYVFAHIELGSAFGRRGLANSALAEYELALKYDNRSFHAHLSAAALLDQLGRQAEVVSHLEQAVMLSPDLFEPQLRLGELLMLQGLPEKAVPHLQIAERLLPKDSRASDLLKEIRNARK